MAVVKCNFSKFEEHIHLLKKIATYSSLTHKHSACLIKGGKICTFGYNRYIKTDIINNKCVKYTIHAEIDALCKVYNKLSKGMDILIIRIGNEKANKLKNSRPCNSCIDKLLQRGIRRVYYSDENGDIVYEFLESMQKIHISSGHSLRCKLKLLQ
jgi:deoxycytidylate deaminase